MKLINIINAAAMSFGLLGKAIAMDMPNVPGLSSYHRRGKGRGKSGDKYSHRNASRYMPHQGKREIARRLARSGG